MLGTGCKLDSVPPRNESKDREKTSKKILDSYENSKKPQKEMTFLLLRPEKNFSHEFSLKVYSEM